MRRGGLSGIIEFEIVVKLVEIPVGAAHFESAITTLAIRLPTSIKDDVRELVTARPVFSTDT